MSIDSILRDNDLIAICEHDGAKFRRTGSDMRSRCPIHHGDNTSAFAVFEEYGKQRWKCYTGNCGGGDIIDYIMVRDGIDFKRAYEILGGGQPITSEETIRISDERRKRAEEYEEKKRLEYHQALEELWNARAWETYYKNLESNDNARQLWKQRGIPEQWQDYWQLGYCPDFTYYTDIAKHHSPSLTIPIWNGEQYPSNIRHRILNPFNPTDKYRPDRPGLKALPFIADPFEKDHDCVLVVEGEVKAMVSYIWLDSTKWQVYGIPGKENYRELCESLRGRRVWIAFDPDANDQAEKAANIIGGARILNLPYKIDDALTGGYIDKQNLRYMIKMARTV